MNTAKFVRGPGEWKNDLEQNKNFKVLYNQYTKLIINLLKES